MVTAAAREIKDHEVVFVGMRLPLLAFCLAKATHAPHAIGIFENGVIRDTPAKGPIVTMADPPNQTEALRLCPLSEVMTILSRGKVNLGFIGGAQVDIYGNVNTHLVRGEAGPVRLPGSGGGADIACLARKLAIIMPHEKRRLVPRVDFITSPGWGDTPSWRAEQGLERGGPNVLITTLAVFRFPRGRAQLASIHPGVDAEYLKAETGFQYQVRPELEVTPAPTGEKLEIIRFFDPDRFWTG
ncbi:CoA-transferase subunit beta [Dethiosulfatarculus sandiegensis]|nr:CoA-transferase [Dethiosulfatarculus sandiegensis]